PMAGVDIDTLTMEQYLALSRENQASGVVKPEIRGKVFQNQESIHARIEGRHFLREQRRGCS
ncbi:hypothetical protein Tco_0914556, partial [Tanacetum coccineum]